MTNSSRKQQSEIGMYLYVLIDAIICFDKKKQKHRPPPGDDASTAEAANGRVGINEQGIARRANTTTNGGPHFELGRLRLKTWPKSDFSIVETTWPTYLYISLYVSWRLQTSTTYGKCCADTRHNRWYRFTLLQHKKRKKKPYVNTKCLEIKNITYLWSSCLFKGPRRPYSS